MAEKGNDKNLEHRLDRLEKKVERLEHLLLESSGSDDPRERITDEETAPEDETRITFQETTHKDPTDWIPEGASLGENWLNWLGIGLLLLGVVFLFKYSIDQGWLIPPVRSAFGLAVGMGLLSTGFVARRGTTLRNILLGGGIASFYITGFATFQLYNFISSEIVWLFMVGVTILALVLSLRQDEAILSVLGSIGGLGTPFMLYSGDGSLLMLMLYTGLLLSGSGAIYMVKGWKSLLWAYLLGGWLVLGVGWYNGIHDTLTPSAANRWILQGGAIFLAFVGWIVPVLREVLTYRNPGRWPDPMPRNSTEQFVANTGVQVVTVLMPVALLFYSYGIWSLGTEIWGAIALLGSLVVGYSYLPLRNEGLKKLSLMHGFTALILITISLFLLLEGEILLIALALEALCLRIIASQTGDVNISISSHILFGLIGIWMMGRFFTSTVAEFPILNLDAVTELFIIGIGGLMVPRYLTESNRNSLLIYRLAAHIALLGWFLKELYGIQDGHAFVTVSWGIYALLLLVAGFWQNSTRIRSLGMATIFLVVAKLFLIDLTQINTLLRILLFIGFGILFLLMSYFLHKRWGSFFGDRDETNPSTH